jgi:ABC-type multidrug transport system ATPase subunit
VSAIKLLFDRVLLLDEGETIILNFKTEKDLRSKKVMLFREKTKYEKALNGASFKAIFIGQKVDKVKGVFELKLSTNGTDLDWLSDAIVKRRGGETKPLDLEVEGAETVRIKKLQSM